MTETLCFGLDGLPSVRPSIYRVMLYLFT